MTIGSWVYEDLPQVNVIKTLRAKALSPSIPGQPSLLLARKQMDGETRETLQTSREA